jgi:hypothetical protein
MAKPRRKTCTTDEKWGEITPVTDIQSDAELSSCHLAVKGSSIPSLYRTRGIVYRVVSGRGSLFYGIYQDGALVKLRALKLAPRQEGSLEPGVAHIFISNNYSTLKLRIIGGKDQLSGLDREAVPPSEIAGKELEFTMLGRVLLYEGTTCYVDINGHRLAVENANARWGVDHDLPTGELVEAPAIVRLGRLNHVG